MEIDTKFVCAYCLQINSIVVDGSAGMHQRYIEDCQVCCRPNDLHITIDAEMSEAHVQAFAG